MREIEGFCSFNGCGKKHLSKGFCANHYQWAKRQGIVGSKKECTVEGCSGFQFAKGYCERHYQQATKSIGIRRTCRDPNETWFSADTCFIQIYDQHGDKKHIAMVDKEDYDKIKNHKWFSLKTGCGVWYVYTMIKRESVALHHMVFGRPQKGFEIDHKNRNTFDNHKDNLRKCTRAENVCNVAKYPNKSSKFKGVSYSKPCKKWMANIRKNGILNYLGLFEKETEAAIAYNNAAKRLHGEFAYLNEINP